MKPAKSADALLENVEAIVSSAKGQGLVVFYGWAHGTDQKTVNWNEEHGGDWEKFLECAKAAARECFTLIGRRLRSSRSTKRLSILKKTVAAQSEARDRATRVLYLPIAR